MRSPPALLFSVLVACSSGGEPAARDAAAIAKVGVPDDVRPAEPDERVDAAAPVAVADPVARLRAGRELARGQRWKEAIAALDEAAAGGDPTALAELAYTAMMAGDSRRTEAASLAVLELPGLSDRHRATAYYHLGRAAELRSDVDEARDAYRKAIAIDARSPAAERVDQVAVRPRPAPPAPPACTQPVPVDELCACIAADATPRCVDSHRHGGSAWALTLVTRERAPTYLVASAGKGKAQVIAALGVPVTGVAGAELTIIRWNVLAGPGGAAMVRVDTRQSVRDDTGASRPLREDMILCVTTGTPRCLAAVPLLDTVGTPAQTRRTEVSVEASDDHGELHVTLVEGPPTPPDVLGTHFLW